MNWIKKALFLGLSFYVAILLVKPIGVSTQYSVASGMVHKLVKPDIIWETENGYASSNEYYNKDNGKIATAIMNPISYNLVFVLAIPVGNYLGYQLTSNKNKFIHKKKSKIFHKEKNLLKIYGPSFASGFLLLYGARMAGGCTSGHMMSGMMQGSISGYVFAMCVFAVAIPFALLTHRA